MNEKKQSDKIYLKRESKLFRLYTRTEAMQKMYPNSTKKQASNNLLQVMYNQTFGDKTNPTHGWAYIHRDNKPFFFKKK